MSAHALIEEARADGLGLRLSGDKLRLRGTVEVVERWKPRIVASKPEIMAALQSAPPDPDPVEVACSPHAQTLEQQPNSERIQRVAAQLEDDPGLMYAMETHDEADVVILSLAIRGKGACEVHIPKSRYDGIALLELIEKHTTRETLQ